jgi:hypothetical protein
MVRIKQQSILLAEISINIAIQNAIASGERSEKSYLSEKQRIFIQWADQ